MSHSARLWITAVLVLGAMLTSSPVSAQQVRTVAGLVINFGIVPAEVALQAGGHQEAHPAHPPSGSQHLLVTLDDEKTRARIGDADVVIVVTDPRGHTERKPLLRTQAGGLPDYSELFVFSWSGEYKVNVLIARKQGGPRVETTFVVHHTV